MLPISRFSRQYRLICQLAYVMTHTQRICFLGFVVGITCLVLSLNFYFPKNFEKIKHKPINSCIGRTPGDTITPLGDQKVLVIAPYYDNREENIIRILAIIHHKEVEELYCYFCCSSDTVLQTTKAKIDIHGDRFDFPFGLTDIICAQPSNCKPSYVSIHRSPYEDTKNLIKFQIRNRDPGKMTANFTVCISTMFGNYSNILQFIQTIEMYKILGAQKVDVYLNNCSQHMAEVLQFYRREGTVEIIPWHIHRYLKISNSWRYENDDKELGYYGQISTLNDCVYRNMYSSKYVVLNDQDEIILPFHHRTWDHMMESLEKENPDVGIFLFENHIFPQTTQTNVNFPGTTTWKDVPGFNLLQYVHREPDRPNYFNARKMIVDPRAVIQTSVHSTLKQHKKMKQIPLETALVYHCRGPLQHNLPGESLIEDKNIWKFSDVLIKNVNEMIKKFKTNKDQTLQDNQSQT